MDKKLTYIEKRWNSSSIYNKHGKGEVNVNRRLVYIEKRWECPCGKGEVSFSYDEVSSAPLKLWDVVILCPKCQKKYISTADGDLIPIGYPDYNGDANLRQKIKKLDETIRGYGIGCKGWSKELTEERKRKCVRAVKKDKHRLSDYPVPVFDVALDLYRRFSKEDLEAAYNDMCKAGGVTRLEVEVAKVVAEEYEMCFDSVALDKAVLPIYMALCNYENFNQFAEEDAKNIESLKEEMYRCIEEYNKGVPEHEAEKRRHIVRYEGWKSLVKSEDLRAP